MHQQLRVLGLAVLIGACGGGAGAPAAAAPAAADPAVVRTAIEEANRKAIAGMNAGSFEAGMANYAENAIVMMPGMAAMRGTAAIGAGMQGLLAAMDVKDVTATTEDVTVSGDLAVETGTMTMRVGPKGGTLVADTLKYVTVWQHQADGTWKVVRDINNSNVAPKM